MGLVLALVLALQAAPDSGRTVVASGAIRQSAAGGGPIGYVLWRGPGGDVVVDLGDPEGEGVRIPAASVDALGAALRYHFPDDASGDVVAVGVDDDLISVALQQSLRLRTVWVLGALGGALCLVVVLGVVSGRARRRAGTLHQLATHQIEGREAERARIAREIHDGPVQDLSVLAMTLAALEAEEAAPVRSGMQAVARDLRALAEGLRPPVLDRFGLERALRDLAERAAGPPLGLDVSVLVEGAARLQPAHELVFYRVAQEALTNASRHGGGARAHVVLRSTPEAVELTVRDEGSGFGAPRSFDDLVRAGHFGLAGMSERVRAVGGTLRLDDAPEGGARVTVRLPAPS